MGQNALNIQPWTPNDIPNLADSFGRGVVTAGNMQNNKMNALRLQEANRQIEQRPQQKKMAAIKQLAAKYQGPMAMVMRQYDSVAKQEGRDKADAAIAPIWAKVRDAYNQEAQGIDPALKADDTFNFELAAREMEDITKLLGAPQQAAQTQNAVTNTLKDFAIEKTNGNLKMAQDYIGTSMGQKEFSDWQARKLKEKGQGEGKSFNNEEKLRDSFLTANKPFKEIRDAYSRIQAAAKNPSAAGDLALIFNYMKMLDPGSTVREGEFATAQNSAGVPERIIAQYNKTINGQRMADDQRADFVERSKGLYESQNRQYKQSHSEYKRLARDSGLRDNIYPDLSVDLGEQVGLPALNARPSGAPSVAPMTATNPQTGQKIKSLDGGKTWQAM